MKIKTKICAGVVSLAVFIPLAFSADGDNAFEQFKAQQTQGVNSLQTEFDQYKKDLEAGFSAYTKAYQEADAVEQKSVKKVWGDYRPGDKKRWVQYDKTGTRQSVDFESGEVELEMIVDQTSSNDKAELALKKKILALLLTSRRDAFKKDNVAQAVEGKLSKMPLVKTAIVSDAPVLSSLISTDKIQNSDGIKKTSVKFANQSQTDTRAAQKPGKKIVRVKFKIPINIPNKSKQFLKKVQAIATKEKVPLALVMAVMETESAFNPMAKSPVPAYGLMQIVPRSAGQDATAYLFGKAKILSPSYLYDSDKNIEIGGAYLHILYYKYLKKIKDPISRLYCAIAAYNTGAGNVAKAFIGNTNINKAARKINALSSKEVYQKLRRHLPYKETKRYVKKVSRNMQKYRDI